MTLRTLRLRTTDGTRRAADSAGLWEVRPGRPYLRARPAGGTQPRRRTPHARARGRHRGAADRVALGECDCPRPGGGAWSVAAARAPRRRDRGPRAPVLGRPRD